MVKTTPHGEGNIRDHINTEYDPDEDGQIDDIGPQTVSETEVDPSNANADEVLVYDGSTVQWDDTPVEVRNGGGLVHDRLGTLRLGAFITPDSTGDPNIGVDFDRTSYENDTDAAAFQGDGGTSGQVLTTDGSTASWQDPPSGGGGQWTHITTINQSGSDNASHTLSNTWRELQVRITDVSLATTNSTYLRFNVNAVGSGYDWREQGGNSRTSQNGVFVARLDNGSTPGQTTVQFDGVFSENWGGFAEPRSIRNDLANAFQNTGVGSPISSFGFTANNADNWSGTVEIFGRNPV